ncbi:MAG: hypothetical protein ABI443_09145 [Chthoniobacterales bacterium]
MKSHDQIDERSLELHELVADKLARNPALLERAQANLSRWLSARPDELALQEWQEILSRLQLQDVIGLLRSGTEDAARLRQSSPFVGILSSDERHTIFAHYAVARA